MLTLPEQGASYLSANTDDDDISAFVQDIETRKPLQRLREQSESSPAESPVEAPDTSEPERPSALLSRARTLSMPEPMLATEAAVDERLREMNEAFMSSLRGLDSRRRARGGIPSPGGRSTEVRGTSGTPTEERQGGLPLDGARVSPANTGLPATYRRPRMGSTASVRSGFSVASGEVIGKMDPEVGDNPGRSGAS
ncbi:hypothetical protein DAEQUDRAFT_135674 [Daedalea quercina L-15889]|uniref:Uncharacterized protein n=1 Tax=Daedalea quercina L-15889 TaxID=1314783 RepID=A0A165RRF5_9APHY|nr:hypothetical protein DAEQUDRAFT_135674 [Daedalea quercina L-15889]